MQSYYTYVNIECDIFRDSGLTFKVGTFLPNRMPWSSHNSKSVNQNKRIYNTE